MNMVDAGTNASDCITSLFDNNLVETVCTTISTIHVETYLKLFWFSCVWLESVRVDRREIRLRTDLLVTAPGARTCPDYNTC